ncbi:hypothetical protein MBCUT_05170 [Methanobrevibacter cuticularis]|uniref:Uncharacterized protein n=1 Tax=Methanobrevibacter cuticularis TaxID=47311 RepID=A0A166ELX0_9EURY|nr:hypothetical protein [Methanobrevibacter cuticularis]KZX16798.1 hypothetical protein MBCUT_05170 [Methanobrevibacter cuticularis]
MAKIKVFKQNIDEELFIKSEKLRINNKTVQTPIKSFDMTKLRKDTLISPSVKGVNEIFKEFKSNQLHELTNGKRNTEDIYKKLNTSFNKTSKDEINFCFIKLIDKTLPEEKGINIVTNIAYNKSDATPLPLLDSFFNPGSDAFKEYEKYTDFMQRCIDSINRLNNKAILGIIPSKMPEILIKDLIDFYHTNNITSFVFDFDGKTHSGLNGNLRELMISILELDILNESFTYSCNTQRGKTTRGTNVTKANDILVYNYGFDIMGDNHTKTKFPPDVAKKLKERSKDSNIRLFNTKDYGHYRHDTLEEAIEFYPFDETKIPLEYFQAKNKLQKDQVQRLFNSERIGLELLKYRKLIKENERTIKYLETKEQITEDLGNFQNFRNDLNI